MKTARILKEKSREYNGQAYYKYKINIPNVILSKTGFKAGDDLEIEAEEGKIILKKKVD